MPLRTIMLEDGAVCTRTVTDLHPDNTKFLPEEFTIPSGTPDGARIYNALERLSNSEMGSIGETESE